MNNPTLSIIMPSYEQGGFLEDCLMSVETQPLQDGKHILVDRGSNDETIDLLERHENDDNLRWISESDRRQSHTIKGDRDDITVNVEKLTETVEEMGEMRAIHTRKRMVRGQNLSP